MTRFLLLGALLTGSLMAADVDGKWECGVKGPDGVVRPLVATLKADGMKLTGTVNGMNGQPDIEIFDGMNHGDGDVVFQTPHSERYRAVQL